MKATTWKSVAALLLVPALLAIAFLYWARVGNPSLPQATIVWVFVVLVPIVLLYEIAALRGWVAESYIRIPIRKKLACFAAGALGVSLYLLGLGVDPYIGSSSFYVSAAGSGFLAVASALQSSYRLLSFLFFVGTGALFVLFAIG